MDWFKGKLAGPPPVFHGKIHGFQFRFSPSDRQQGAVSILQGPGFHNVHALCVYVCVLHVCIYI